MAVNMKKEMLKDAGKRFREIREKNKFTQEQVASFVGVERSLIAKFEAGERSLGISLLETAGRLFGCELSDILSDGEYKPLAVAYRAKELSLEDMKVISRVQQVALNLRRIKSSLEGCD